MVRDRLTGFQFSGIHLEDVVREGHPPSSSRTAWLSSFVTASPVRHPSTRGGDEEPLVVETNYPRPATV